MSSDPPSSSSSSSSSSACVSYVQNIITSLPVYYYALPIIIIISFKLYKFIKFIQQPKKKHDVIYLYQYPTLPSWTYTPNASPFCLKLQTYLEACRLKYEVVPTMSGHPLTGKLPYIELNEQVVTDSNQIISYLNNIYSLNADSMLTPPLQSQARALQHLIEHSLYHCMVYERWIMNGSVCMKEMVGAPWPLSVFILPHIKRSILKSLRIVGYGHLSYDQIMEQGRKDLDAVSMQLSNNLFLMGAHPTAVDFSCFGVLASIFYPTCFSSKLALYIRNHLLNIEPYLMRMKLQCFPNWDQAIQTARAKQSNAATAQTNKKGD